MTEDTYWTYQIITESEIQGSGSYQGTSVSIKTIDGTVIIKKIDNERIVIEDYQKIILLDYGSGFFKQNRTRETSQTLTYTIDRKSLTVTSYYIKNSTGEEPENMKITGKPTTYFISNSLKRGQTTKYYWFEYLKDNKTIRLLRSLLLGKPLSIPQNFRYAITCIIQCLV